MKFVSLSLIMLYVFSISHLITRIIVEIRIKQPRMQQQDQPQISASDSERSEEHQQQEQQDYSKQQQQEINSTKKQTKDSPQLGISNLCYQESPSQLSINTVAQSVAQSQSVQLIDFLKSQKQKLQLQGENSEDIPQPLEESPLPHESPASFSQLSLQKCINADQNKQQQINNNVDQNQLLQGLNNLTQQQVKIEDDKAELKIGKQIEFYLEMNAKQVVSDLQVHSEHQKQLDELVQQYAQTNIFQQQNEKELLEFCREFNVSLARMHSICNFARTQFWEYHDVVQYKEITDQLEFKAAQVQQLRHQLEWQEREVLANQKVQESILKRKQVLLSKLK